MSDVSEAIPRARRLAPIAFVGSAAAVYAISRHVGRIADGAADPGVLELAATLDLTLFVPLLYYVLLARPRRWPALTVVPVFLASLALAGVVLPPHRHGTLEVVRYLALPAELLLLGAVVVGARRARHAFRTSERSGQGFLERARVAAREALGSERAAEVVAFEVAVLRYALCSWRAEEEASETDLSFSTHRRCGYGGIVLALLLVAVVEVVAVHALVHRWSPLAAWILTTLGLYGMAWLVGDYRAARLRPVLIGPERVSLRLGLRWTLDVPRAAIARVATDEAASRPSVDLLLALPGARALVIELTGPHTACGPYGIRRSVTRIGLGVDDPAAFSRGLARSAHPLTEGGS